MSEIIQNLISIIPEKKVAKLAVFSTYEENGTGVASVKGLVHPKMKILSFITHYPHAVPHL